MEGKFILTPKSADKIEDNHMVISVRAEKEIVEAYDDLSAKSGRSRNAIIVMALRYALDHLEFIPDNEESSEE